jgi:molecular chaperone GrpE
MESVGQPFDPSRHEAVMVDDGDGVADTVVEEYQRGYMVKDSVLRPAMVKVGSAEALNLTTTAMDA